MNLRDIAQQLKIANKKVQLIYAFNGVGKTRLSREFKQLIAPKKSIEESELLPDDKQAYLNRVINFTSHSTLSNEAVAEPSGPEKNTVALLLKHLVTNYSFWQEEKTR